MPRVPQPKMPQRASDALDALGDAVNFAILRTLIRDGAQTRGQLVDRLEVNVNTLQRHLADLRSLGLIEAAGIAEPDGAWHRYEYRAVVDLVLGHYRSLGIELGFTAEPS